jgi:hypothetical protein
MLLGPWWPISCKLLTLQSSSWICPTLHGIPCVCCQFPCYSCMTYYVVCWWHGPTCIIQQLAGFFIWFLSTALPGDVTPLTRIEEYQETSQETSHFRALWPCNRRLVLALRKEFLPGGVRRSQEEAKAAAVKAREVRWVQPRCGHSVLHNGSDRLAAWSGHVKLICRGAPQHV